MEKIKLHDKVFRRFIDAADIENAIDKVAVRMNEDLKDEKPIFLGVLNGAFMFISDIMKRMTMLDCEVYFMKISSYVGTSSTGKVKEVVGLNRNIEGRTVVILEDMIDSGRSMNFLINYLKERKAGKVVVATMFYKPNALQQSVQIDYFAMTLENDFVVGRGLDYDELGRNLPDLYILDNE